MGHKIILLFKQVLVTNNKFSLRYVHKSDGYWAAPNGHFPCVQVDLNLRSSLLFRMCLLHIINIPKELKAT